MQNFLDGKVSLLSGDSAEIITTLPDNSIDSVVCDPPYALVSIVKRFGGANAAPAKGNDAYMRASAGFMGKQWDTGEVAFSAEFWAQVLRVLKPGGHLVAFSGTRTYHRMAVAIEDSGFEIRDQLAWCYGSGFPKSHNAGDGWGTALKPAWEPICLGRKALTGTVAVNITQHGTGGLNIDGCRIESSAADQAYIMERINGFNNTRSIGGNGAYGGGETMDRGANFDASKGRWPANIIHDGSEEVIAAFPDAPGQQRGVGPANGAKDSVNVFGDYGPRDQFDPRGDSGSAARFFYTAKADAEDRLGSKHPTVKPVDLMQWLVRLVTPKNGTVLDPFAGTGTTGEAAFREGMKAILIEREEEYQKDIARRMELVLAGPMERKLAARAGKVRPVEDNGTESLFGFSGE